MQLAAALPRPSVETGLSRYLDEIKKFPLLTPEEELAFAKRGAIRRIATLRIAW